MAWVVRNCDSLLPWQYFLTLLITKKRLRKNIQIFQVFRRVGTTFDKEFAQSKTSLNLTNLGERNCAHLIKKETEARETDFSRLIPSSTGEAGGGAEGSQAWEQVCHSAFSMSEQCN